ncbi:MAG: trehalose-phosphatase [Pseudonocardia sp. SCN 73-27]|uniref:trehalose-phosphatase n=1 Tax=unclassified Pseudonocardia TaxID=2619320 RepID=UPI00086BA78F|nr:MULTISPECIES: trehalose-phosphatase [unclassified Pseudonocardia]ODU24283.1 MAG: trehalose-phosphatase [Pseudonocardia sp. SCN 72-51]ODV01741.1 MAG: trehalose-phosphatase [Pseudonocardia sp. SCN 73-27]
MTDRVLDIGLEEALRRVASVPRLLVALDFDGVLAPIVPVPSDARPLPASARAIEGLAGLADTTVALVSGRGLDDLRAVSGFGSPLVLVGSHGGEFSDAGADLLDDTQQTRRSDLLAELEKLIDGEPGVGLERKPAGAAVHVRNATPDVAERVLAAVRTGPAAASDIDAIEGKAVIDLAVVEVSKGGAIDVLRARTGADAVLFAGDDVTDETGFARLGDGDVGIKVGEGPTAAAHRVTDPEAMSHVLGVLRDARSATR